ncbi:MAG: FAD-binding oxidoreductase [Gemmatimonadetes bacterium]|nr:FAD-binding oxidoreductase [Gemmatimonadota bacterium]
MTRRDGARVASRAEQALFGDDVPVAAPRDTAALAETLRDAVAQGVRIRPAGLGAHPADSDPVETPRVVSVAAFDRIVAHSPNDFTVGVEAGVPLATLRAELARHGQEVPADLPATGTIGGWVARGAVSPRQGRHGPLASLVLGVEGVRTSGETFRSGGMVVKNVAGYALHKFLVGSRGTSAVLTRVNLRLRQLPETRTLGFLRGAATELDEAAEKLATSGLEPVLFRLEGAAAATLPDERGPGSAVAFLFEGNRTRVAWQIEQAHSVLPNPGAVIRATDDDAAAWLDRLVAFGEPPENPRADVGVFRLSVPAAETLRAAHGAATAIEAREGLAHVAADPMTGLITIRQEDERRLDQSLAALRNVATRHRGFVRAISVPPGAHAALGRVATAGHELRERVRRVFDPGSVLS